MELIDATEIIQRSLLIGGLIAAPLLGACLLVSLLTGVIQSWTGIQDQTLSVVPKLVVMAVVLAICAPWLIQMMTELMQDIYLSAPQVVTGTLS